MVIGLDFCRSGYFSRFTHSLQDHIQGQFNPHITYLCLSSWYINKAYSHTVWLSRLLSNRRNFMKMFNKQSSYNCGRGTCEKACQIFPVLPLLLPHLSETWPPERRYVRKEKAITDIWEPTWHNQAIVFLEAVLVPMLLSCWRWRISQNNKVTRQLWSYVTKQDHLVILSEQRRKQGQWANDKVSDCFLSELIWLY